MFPHRAFSPEGFTFLFFGNFIDTRFNLIRPSFETPFAVGLSSNLLFISRLKDAAVEVFTTESSGSTGLDISDPIHRGTEHALQQFYRGS